MINRAIKEAGMHPLLAYIVGCIAFVVLSEIIFWKTAFAEYLIIFICMAILIKLLEKDRSDFLLITYGDAMKRSIRLIENMIISIPFIVVLIFKNAYYESSALLIISALMAVFPVQVNLNFSLPTPFPKHLYEFTTGFRRTFYLFPIAYALTIVAIRVENFNLGIFSILLIFLISMSYYLKPENEYYVWIYTDTPGRFLMHKIKLATRNVFLLSLPSILSVLAFYPANIIQLLIFILIGNCFLWTLILAKYSAYPREMNITEGILLALSIYFPPLLIALMPFFYTKSIRKLKAILHDQD